MRGEYQMNTSEKENKIDITAEICNKHMTFTKQASKNGSNTTKMLAKTKQQQTNTKDKKE